MKKNLFFMPFLVTLFACNSQSPKDYYIKNAVIYEIKTNKPYNGIIKAADDDKNVQFEVKNGIKNGSFIITLKNGTVIMKGTLENGRNTGTWKYFYKTGELESQGEFVNDIPEGIWKWYFPDGKLRENGKYIKGNRDSTWVTFSENGDTVLKKNFKMGKEIPD